MIEPTDFGMVIVKETDDYENFPRKKLLKTYNKFNNISNAFKHNQYSLGASYNDLTKVELKLIYEEIDAETYKYMCKNESKMLC